MTTSDWIGLLGILVSLVGFALTVWQLIRTANAAEATRAAIVGANKRMVLNHLLVLLPQLKSVEADLDTAIANDDRVAAIRALVEYSHTAIQVASLLESNQDTADTELVASLRSSAQNASANKAAIVSGVTKPLGTMLRTVAKDIGSASSACAGLSTKYQTKVA